MSTLLHHALHAGQAAASSPAKATAAPRRVLVAGAGGPLGSAVLEQALARGGFARVLALTRQPMAPAVRTFLPLHWDELQAAGPDLAIDTALVVFDRTRHSNGRDEAFYQPQPDALLALAGQLHRRGVHRLVVVMPHVSALMPQALKQGLASLDELGVAALGFDQLLMLRPAEAPGLAGQAHQSGLQRVANGLLRQLHWMVPQQAQPVRASAVARFAVALAKALPAHGPGTRIAPAELVWRAAQLVDASTLASAWLAGQPLPAEAGHQVRRW